MLKFAGCTWLCSTKAKWGSRQKLRTCEIAFLNLKATWRGGKAKIRWWKCCKIDGTGLKVFWLY